MTHAQAENLFLIVFFIATPILCVIVGLTAKSLGSLRWVLLVVGILMLLGLAGCIWVK